MSNLEYIPPFDHPNWHYQKGIPQLHFHLFIVVLLLLLSDINCTHILQLCRFWGIKNTFRGMKKIEPHVNMVQDEEETREIEFCCCTFAICISWGRTGNVQFFIRLPSSLCLMFCIHNKNQMIYRALFYSISYPIITYCPFTLSICQHSQMCWAQFHENYIEARIGIISIRNNIISLNHYSALLCLVLEMDTSLEIPQFSGTRSGSVK